MTNEPNRSLPQRKPEQDAARNIDSMMPATNGGREVVRDEALPKSRKQRRLEKTGIMPVQESEPDSADILLRAKAKRFSRMVFNDTSLDRDNFPSFGVSHEEAPLAKKGKGSKKIHPEESMEIHAFNTQIDALLEKFIKQENGN